LGDSILVPFLVVEQIPLSSTMMYLQNRNC
jgi:hypothetical protein